ncbi:hypothetical protein B1R94_14510 [Mycolicibacterium litorale]|nr:hypothetical protein B1R94_14510 [Mycolicibacterium litorale]
MSPRITHALVAVCWTVGGALIALNPHPPGGRRAAALPVAGWIMLGGGIALAAKTIKSPPAPRANSSRHSSGAESSVLDAVKLVAAGLGCALLCVGCLWWGVASGYLSVVGIGVVGFGLFVGVAPHAVPATRWLLQRDWS